MDIFLNHDLSSKTTQNLVNLVEFFGEILIIKPPHRPSNTTWLKILRWHHLPYACRHAYFGNRFASVHHRRTTKRFAFVCQHICLVSTSQKLLLFKRTLCSIWCSNYAFKKPSKCAFTQFPIRINKRKISYTTSFDSKSVFTKSSALNMEREGLDFRNNNNNNNFSRLCEKKPRSLRFQLWNLNERRAHLACGGAARRKYIIARFGHRKRAISSSSNDLAPHGKSTVFAHHQRTTHTQCCARCSANHVAHEPHVAFMT